MVRCAGFALAVLIVLAACAGGNTAPPTLGAPQQPHGTSATVRATIVVGTAASKALQSRHRLFISSSTSGVLVTVYAHSDTEHATMLGESTTDISPGSSACGGVTTSPRTCDTTVVAPFGDDDFVLTTYDAPPVNGSFANAHVLGTTTVTQTIASSGNNAISAVISGTIASIGATPAFMSFPADGTAHTLAVVVTPQDFDDNPIVAGQNDPYSNPIAVTLTESGGSGHATLLFDGKPTTGSATLTQSSDTVAVTYDGGGTAGYNATLALSATGVTPQSVQLSPIYLASTSQYFASNAIAFTASTQTAALTLSEAHFTGTYAATPTGCSGIATATVTGSTITIAAGSSVVGPGVCSFAISDGISTIPIGTSTTQTGTSVVIPGSGVTFTEFPSGASALSAIAPGPDGNMWFTDVTGAHVGKITPEGAVTLYNAAGGSEPFDIAAGPDGNLWFTEITGEQIGRITTSGTIATYSVTASDLPYGIALGPDGNLWFAATGPTPGMGRITTAGVLSFFPFAGSSFYGVGAGPDGNIWFCDDGNNAIGNITPSGTYTEYTIPTSGASPSHLVAGPDGNVWFTETLGNKIGKITTGGTITEYTVPTASSQPSFITVGADGNLWFSEDTANKIAKITTAGAITEYPIPTASSGPAGIAAGANGTIWFTEGNTGKIGVLQY